MYMLACVVVTIKAVSASIAISTMLVLLRFKDYIACFEC